MTANRSGSAEASPAAVEAAIGWMVKLQSGHATPQDHQACRHWQGERPEHAQAWAALHAISLRMKALPSALAHGTLAGVRERTPPRPRRRTVLKSVLLLGGAGGLGLAASTDGGWHALAAGHRTGVGERRRVALADGSVLHLNTATALDARLDAHARCVTLHAGEMLVECAPDRESSPPRPFLVRTAEGEVQAREGRFVVRQLAGRTAVQALAGWLEVSPRNPGDAGPTRLRLGPGQQCEFDARGIHPASSADDGAGAWVDGLLVARDMRLDTLAAELGRHRRGWLRCAPAVAELRISGVFPVNDLGRAMAALQRTLPVRARALTPWWVTIGPR